LDYCWQRVSASYAALLFKPIRLLLSMSWGTGLSLFAGGAPFVMPFALQSDPGPGGLASVLTYDLLGPPSLVAGDVLLQDGAGGPILDVIRFNPAGTGGAAYPASLLFYSDNVDGFDSLGDTSSPPGAFYTNTVTILEVGSEGDNGAFYAPTHDRRTWSAVLDSPEALRLVVSL
jgi:hypothetical protein